jgi:uncharacterized protein
LEEDVLERFFPGILVDKIQDIDFEILKQRNIKGLILDIDNTLVPYSLREADENAVKWIEGVTGAGLKACIVSNNSEKRVIEFNKRLKLPAVHRALKPRKRAFKEAMELMGISPPETAVIGDQIFTDIYGGNRLGLYTILVKPIDTNEQFMIKMKRILEKIVMHSFNRKLQKLT